MVKNEERCENCVHYAKAVMYSSANKKNWLGFTLNDKVQTPVVGKGVCTEPSVFGPDMVHRPLVVLDMAVCSLFSAKSS